MPSKIPDAYFGKWKDRVKLLIVLVVDGVRLSDTKGRLPFINSMVDENMLAKIPFQTSGTTLTLPGHVALATGVTENYMDNHNPAPAKNPTFLHRYLAQNPRAEGHFICSKGKLQNALSPPFHQHMIPNMKQLHNNFGQAGKGIGYRNDNMTKKHILHTIREAADRSIETTVIFVNFHETDSFGHMNDKYSYLEAIKKSDQHIKEIMEVAEENFEDEYALFVTSDHGRHTNDFSEHGCDCLGCKKILLVAKGPYMKSGNLKSNAYGKDTVYSHIDLYTTISVLLGIQPVKTKEMKGKFIHDLF